MVEIAETPEQDVGKRLLAALGMMGRKKGTMPMRTFSNIPVFRGSNVDSFLDRYNTVADDFEVPDTERVKGLVYYLQEEGPKNILQFARSLPEWDTRNWSAMQDVLRRTFPDDVKERAKFTIDDLRSVMAKPREPLTMKDLSDYYFEYKMKADYLLKVQDITAKEHGTLFFRGLPAPTRYALEAREKVKGLQEEGYQAPRRITLDSVYADCRDLLQKEGLYSDANTSLERRINAAPADRPLVRAVPVTADERDVGMEALVKLFEDMRVEFAQMKTSIQSNPAPARNFNNNQYRSNNDNGAPRQYQNTNSKATGANAVPVGDKTRRTCPYDGCEKRKNDCDALREDLSKGLVKTEQGSGHLLYPDGSRVPFAAGSMIHLIRNNRGTVQIQSIELGMYEAPAISAPDVQYINNINKARVSFDDEYEVEEKHGLEEASQSNREIRRPRLSIPQVVIDNSRPPRPSPNATPLQASRGSSNRDPPAFNPPTASGSGSRPDASSSTLKDKHRAVPDDDMADDEDEFDLPPPLSDRRKTNDKRMPGSTLWAPVNERIGSQEQLINNLVEQILDSQISVPVGSILGISTQASKKMGEWLHRRRVPVPTSRPFAVRSAQVNETQHDGVSRSPYSDVDDIPAPLYTHAIGRVRVKLNGHEVTAIIDTGSEINVMPRRTWSKLGCHLREDGRHTTVSANTASSLLLGIAEDLDLSIGQLRTNAHFFVTERASWDLLLGMPLLSHLNAKIWFEERALWLRLTDEDGHVIKIRSTVAADERNRAYVPVTSSPTVASTELQKQDNFLESQLSFLSITSNSALDSHLLNTHQQPTSIMMNNTVSIKEESQPQKEVIPYHKIIDLTEDSDEEVSHPFEGPVIEISSDSDSQTTNEESDSSWKLRQVIVATPKKPIINKMDASDSDSADGISNDGHHENHSDEGNGQETTVCIDSDDGIKFVPTSPGDSDGGKDTGTDLRTDSARNHFKDIEHSEDDDVPEIHSPVQFPPGLGHPNRIIERFPRPQLTRNRELRPYDVVAHYPSHTKRMRMDERTLSTAGDLRSPNSTVAEWGTPTPRATPRQLPELDAELQHEIREVFARHEKPLPSYFAINSISLEDMPDLHLPPPVINPMAPMPTADQLAFGYGQVHGPLPSEEFKRPGSAPASSFNSSEWESEDTASFYSVTTSEPGWANGGIEPGKVYPPYPQSDELQAPLVKYQPLFAGTAPYPVAADQDNSNCFPGVEYETACHIVGDGFIILKQGDVQDIKLDYIDVGRTYFFYSGDKIIVSIAAAMKLGRRAFAIDQIHGKTVQVLADPYTGSSKRVDVLGVIPCVTVRIGDVYELITDVCVVAEVDERFQYEVIIGSQLLFRPDPDTGRSTIGYEQDGAFHIHRQGEVLAKAYCTRSLTMCNELIYDFGEDRALSPFWRCTGKTPYNGDCLLTWSFFVANENSYLSEKCIVSCQLKSQSVAHGTASFGDPYDDYRVTIVGYANLDVELSKTCKGTIRVAIVRGQMPADLVLNGEQLLNCYDPCQENILVDTFEGGANSRYFGVPEYQEVWISRRDGHLDVALPGRELPRLPLDHSAPNVTSLHSLLRLKNYDTRIQDEEWSKLLSLISDDGIMPPTSMLAGSSRGTASPSPTLCDSDDGITTPTSRHLDSDDGIKTPTQSVKFGDSEIPVCTPSQDVSDDGISSLVPCLCHSNKGMNQGNPLVPPCSVDSVAGIKTLVLKPVSNHNMSPTTPKVKPLNVPLPAKYAGDRFFKPEMERNLDATPLTPHPPIFEPTAKLSLERLDTMHFGPDGWLSFEEKQLMLHVLSLRQAAIAFDKSEKGCLKSSYASDYVIPIVDHVPWQDKSIPTSKALYSKVVDLLKDELAAGDLEPSSAPYSTRWFVVQKKDGKIRKVDGAESLNKLCVKDSGIPPNMEDFQMSFTGRVCYALADMISGYDQRRLAVESRDLTTIRTPLGLLRRTRLPQGYTNAVAEFQRTMTHVLNDEIPQCAEVFIDDVGIKGPTSNYDEKPIPDNPNIRQWVWEHAINLERILYRFEHAGLTVSGKKFVVIAPALEIVGTVIDKRGRRIAQSKVNKISTWPNPCPNVTSLRGFLGLVGFVRPFIKNFAIEDAPLRKLLEKTRKFEWTTEASIAVDRLKEIAGSSDILYSIDYECGKEIVLAVDSSHIATGFALYQMSEDGKRLPCRFDSLAFNPRESRYSQPKLELCGVYKALRKMRLYLFGTKFTLEVDARSLVQMFNAPELPNAPMTRWIAFIKLFDFELRHVPATQHTIPDALSRKEPTTGDESPFDADDAADEDLDVWNLQLANNGESERKALPIPNRVWLQEYSYETSPDWLALGKYLETGVLPEGLNAAEQRNLLRRSPGFFLRNGRLFRRNKRGVPQEVVLKEDIQRSILEEIHEKAGHRGRDACLSHIRERFWWPRLYDTIKCHIRSCEPCQKRHTGRQDEVHQSTAPSRLFQKVGIDLVHLGEGSGPFPYLVVARDDLSNWVEAREIRTKHAETVRTFIERDLVCRYGPIMEWITTDGGGETKRETAAYLKKLNIPIVRAVPYHPQANGMIERGHGPSVEACLKMCGDRKTDWHKYLPTALWADRITTRRTTGRSPFEVVFGAAPLLPVDVEFETWLFCEWSIEMTTAELLEARMRQIARRDEDLVIALAKLAKSREQSISYLDKRMAHRLRQPLKPGQLVLQHDTKLSKQWSHRVKDRWFGPFVVEKRHERGSYYLREVDGTPRAMPVAASRLRRFFPRGRRLLDTDYLRGDPHDFSDPVAEHVRRHEEEQDEQPGQDNIDRTQDIPPELDEEEVEEWVAWNEAARRRHYPTVEEDDDEETIVVASRQATRPFQPIRDVDFREEARSALSRQS